MAELMILGDGEMRLNCATIGQIQWAGRFPCYDVVGVWEIDADWQCDCCESESDPRPSKKTRGARNG